VSAPKKKRRQRVVLVDLRRSLRELEALWFKEELEQETQRSLMQQPERLPWISSEFGEGNTRLTRGETSP